MAIINRGERVAILATIIIIALVALIGLWLSDSQKQFDTTPEMQQRAIEFIDSARAIEAADTAAQPAKSEKSEKKPSKRKSQAPKVVPKPPPTPDVPTIE